MELNSHCRVDTVKVLGRLLCFLAALVSISSGNVIIEPGEGVIVSLLSVTVFLGSRETFIRRSDYPDSKSLKKINSTTRRCYRYDSKTRMTLYSRTNNTSGKRLMLESLVWYSLVSQPQAQTLEPLCTSLQTNLYLSTEMSFAFATYANQPTIDKKIESFLKPFDSFNAS